MVTMQDRIDALIRMRKEKPEHKWEWEKLSNALLHETNLLTEEQSSQLRAAFKNIQQEELLKVWDDRFHEVLITGKMTDEYSIAMDNSFSSGLVSNVGTATWGTASTSAAGDALNAQLIAQDATTKDLLRAYKDQYKKKTK